MGGVNGRCTLGKGAGAELHAHQRKDDDEEKEEREVARLKKVGVGGVNGRWEWEV